MHLTVRLPSGRNLSVFILPSSTVATVKGVVANLESIPAAEQRLVFADKTLEDSETMSELSVANYSVFTLLLRLRGGVAKVVKTNTKLYKLQCLKANITLKADYSNGTILGRIQQKLAVFVEEADLDARAAFKKQLASLDLKALEDIHLELSEGSILTAEKKMKAINHLLFGAELQGVYKANLDYTSILSNSAAVVEYAYSLAASGEGAFTVETFTELVKSALNYKQGQTSVITAAVESVVAGFEDMQI